MSWMDHAACVSKTYLPWTAEPGEVSEFQQRAMRAVCGTCPVLDTCQGYADARELDAGYWAGRPRGPQPPRVVVPLVLERPETFEERAARVNTLKEARRKARHLARHQAHQAQRARQSPLGYGS